MTEKIDVGKSIGCWDIIAELPCVNKNKKFMCICNKCGVTQKEIFRSTLASKECIHFSCGCLKRISAPRERKYSQQERLTLVSYNAMLYRCSGSKKGTGRYYENVTICNRWDAHVGGSFEDFLSDMGVRPSVEHSLERVDNDKGYSKENCTWILKSLQQRNRRNTIWVLHLEKKIALKEFCEIVGLKYKTVCAQVARGNFISINQAGGEFLGKNSSS